jgi:hypothetical protein
LTKRYRYSDPLVILLTASLLLTFLYWIARDYLLGEISFTDMVVDIAEGVASVAVGVVLFVELNNWLESRVKPRLKEKLGLEK